MVGRIGLIIERVEGNVHPLPQYKSRGAAAMDLYSNMPGHTMVSPANVLKVHTGIKVKIPKGYYGQLLCRGSLGSKGVAVLGGVIDSDYRGEIVAMLTLTRPGSVDLKPGDRVCQMAILPVPEVIIVEGKVDNDTERGEDGFGSTGR